MLNHHISVTPTYRWENYDLEKVGDFLRPDSINLGQSVHSGQLLNHDIPLPP